MAGFLAQATINGLAFLAPALAPAVPVDAVTAGLPFLAPATINGLPYLAPPTVPPQQVQSVVGGRGARRATSGIKSAPSAAPSRYHGRSYEQEEQAAAAELDDEETVIALMMEIALHV